MWVLTKLLALTVFIVYMMGTTWLFYLAVMNLQEHKDKLTLPVKVFGYPILYVGLLFDATFNITCATLFLLELPHEWLFTARCKRHLHDTDFRGTIVRWFCKYFLDPFTVSGNHCGY